MNATLLKVLKTDAPTAVVLVRLAVGWIFLSEGIQKFLYPAALGAGRFVKIGIPWPEVMGPFVGTVELGVGALILLGILTRPVALALAFNMLVAFTSTKIPMLLGHGFWGFADPTGDKIGFWAMAHESRTDLAMLLSALFLLTLGAGALSLDAKLSRHRKSGLDGQEASLQRKEKDHVQSKE